MLEARAELVLLDLLLQLLLHVFVCPESGALKRLSYRIGINPCECGLLAGSGRTFAMPP
jgi:hypothetical protein